MSTAMHLLQRVIIALVLTAMIVTLAPSPAQAEIRSDAEQLLTTLLNNERTSRGLPPLTVKTDMRDVSRSWSAQMAKNQTLAHNPNYTGQVCCWTWIAENVGMAWSTAPDVQGLARTIHKALMDSPGHRANILSKEATEIGIGAYYETGGTYKGPQLWVTQVFRKPKSSAPAPQPSPTSEPAPTETSSPAPAPTPTSQPSPTPTSRPASAPAPAPEEPAAEPVVVDWVLEWDDNPFAEPTPAPTEPVNLEVFASMTKTVHAPGLDAIHSGEHPQGAAGAVDGGSVPGIMVLLVLLVALTGYGTLRTGRVRR